MRIGGKGKGVSKGVASEVQAEIKDTKSTKISSGA